MKKLILSLLFVCLNAHATLAVTKEDVIEISSAITTMFDAMKKEDVVAIWELQTDDTRNLFKDGISFLAALKDCCNALHDVTNAEIADVRRLSETQLSVIVKMSDGEGFRYLAQFVMEHPDKWKIDQIHIKLIDQKGKKVMSI